MIRAFLCCVASLWMAQEPSTLPVLPGPRTLPSAPPVDLPKDHGQHPQAAFERWVLQGVLQGGGPSRRYALQAVFARRAVRDSWRGDRWWVAQVKLTPVQGRRFVYEERLGREGFPAWASQDRLNLHVDGWSLAQTPSGLSLRARLEEGVVDLELFSPVPALSLPPAEGRPLHRVLQPLLRAQGHLSLQGQLQAVVQGRFSLLHEWGEPAAEPWIGWDQLLLHFNDGRTWLLDGGRLLGKTLGAHTQLIEVDSQGRLSRVASGPLLASRRTWTSPISRAPYPVSLQILGWRELAGLQPVLDDQELRPNRPGAAILYRGFSILQDGSGDPRGDAFLELTGYAHPMHAAF